MRFLELEPYLKAEWLVFDCPCRDGSRIRIMIGPNAVPEKKIWSMSGWPTDNMTITPSIDLRGGGHPCHFNVTNGEVLMTP